MPASTSAAMRTGSAGFAAAPPPARSSALLAFVLATAALTVAPLAMVFSSWLQPQADTWDHLLRHVLPQALGNTALLLAGVGAGVLSLGVSLAWLTTQYRFPGQRFFSWALVLPLAMPGYVMATVYLRLFDYSGPLSSAMRQLFGEGAPNAPIRSAFGCIATLALCLYPYVYLVTRNAFASQGRRAMEAAQVLGMSRRRAFLRAVLPMARPWWMAGLGLALMETLADFGTVAAFNYATLTTAIYKSWVGLFNPAAASQLASLLMLFVFGLMTAQRGAERGRYGTTTDTAPPTRLTGAKGWLAALGCALVLGLAFVLPMAQLLIWAKATHAEVLDSRYLSFVENSLALAAAAAALICALGVPLALADRHAGSGAIRALIRLTTLGYAFPGLVLAAGVISATSLLASAFATTWPGAVELLQGSVGVVLAALCVRFLAVVFQPLQGALHRITASQVDAARGLGARPWRLWRTLHWPLLRASVLSAALLVFVEVMKEMPITLMTRPFGWDTLAVRVFDLTSEGMWEHAALPGLFIVAAGLLPVWLLMRRTAP